MIKYRILFSKGKYLPQKHGWFLWRTIGPHENTVDGAESAIKKHISELKGEDLSEEQVIATYDKDGNTVMQYPLFLLG